MFEKSKINKILVAYPKADKEERKALLERLKSFGSMVMPVLFDMVRSDRILFADGAQIVEAIFKIEELAEYTPMLADAKQSVRDLARRAITGGGRGAAISKLPEQIGCENHAERKEITKLIIELCDSSSAGKLIPFLRHESKDVKKAALDCLTGLKAESSAEAIASLLTDSDSWIRRKAAESLTRLGAKSVLPQLKEAMIREHDPSMTRTVIVAIGEMGGASDAHALLKMVEDQDMVIRNLATDAIIKVGDSSLVGDIINLLGNEDVNIRRSAVHILNSLKDTRTAGAMVKALKDGDWWVRESATDALSELGGGTVSHMVMQLLDDEDENVRRAAVEFFCRVRDESVYPKIVTLLHDTDWWVREKAVQALGLIGNPEGIEPIAELIDDHEVKWALAGALKKIGTQEVLPYLAKLAKDPQKHVRSEAVKALCGLDLDGTIELLKISALDDDSEIKSEALDGLKAKTGRAWSSDEISPTSAEVVCVNKNGSPGDVFSEAILVVDLAKSTDLATRFGDSIAYEMANELHDTIMPIADNELISFSKSTGDGFLMTFPTIEQAMRVAISTLSQIGGRNKIRGSAKPEIDLRFALNIGETRVGNSNDRVGLAVNMAFRIEGIQGVGSEVSGTSLNTLVDLPAVNRVLLSEPAHQEMIKQDWYRGALVGYHELKGISGLHPIYLYTG